MRPLKTDWQQKHLAMEATPVSQFMADRVQAWCGRAAKNMRQSRHVCITGPFGVGKTMCLRAAKKFMQAASLTVWPQFWPRPVIVWGVNWPEFVAEQAEMSSRESMQDMMGADVVFLDDIGAEDDRYKGGTGTRILADVLGGLHNRFVFITTNIRPNAWKDRWDGRVQDRLLRDTEIVNLWDASLNAQSYSVAALKTAS